NYRIKPRLVFSMIWFPSGRRKEFIAGAFLLAMALSHAIILFGLAPFLRSGYQNFTIFYSAGKMIRTGNTLALYDLSKQYETQRQIAPDVRIRQAALPYNHPPFEALLFAPLTLFPYWTAYLLWSAFNIALTAVIIALLRKHFAEIRNLSWAFLLLAPAGFFPIVSSVIQGNDCVPLLLLSVLAVIALENGNDALAGAMLAAGLFRFQIALPLAMVLAVRRWRLLLGFVPVAAALVAVSLAMIGFQGVIGYLRLVQELESRGAGAGIVAAGMPNLRGMVAALPGLGAGTIMLVTAAGSVA